jgi:flagellar basal-body rod protein FlgG
MIEGEGFFQVRVEEDLGEGLAYTRAGNFTLNSEGDIVLATDQGRRLVPEFQLPANTIGVTVRTDGTLSVTVAGQTDPIELGTIELATFVNPAGLRQVGENLFLPSEASGEALVGDPLEDGRGAIRQGFLEGSNVDPVTELVNLIRTQRAFEMNSQSIQAADETLRTVSQLRRF